MTRSLRAVKRLAFAGLVTLVACGAIPEAEEPNAGSPTGSTSGGADSLSARSDSSSSDTLASSSDTTSADTTAAAPDSSVAGTASADTTAGDAAADTTVASVPPVYGCRVIADFPHDPNAYTQGLVFVDSVLYEGTGLWGQSTLRRVRLETGEVLASRSLPGQYFGEGIAAVGDSVYQLTWRSGEAFLYRKDGLERIGGFRYATEGWGLTWDGARLVMSDGTSTLTFRDPRTFEEVGRVTVTDLSGPVARLNELEYIEGEVFANVWQTDRIARIDPTTGRVTGWIDLTGLLDPAERRDADAVLNGIAYDAENRRLFVTGKLWPRLFEIELVPR